MTTDTGRTGCGLGRGLAALIPQREEQRPPDRAADRRDRATTRISRARSSMRSGLDELAASIADARRPPADPGHASRRPAISYRGRAAPARRARWPASIASRPWCAAPTSSEQLALALVENLQRADLNALEEAHAFRQLMTSSG